MREVLFLPPSDREMDDAIAFYEKQQSGLGTIFFHDLLDSITLIQKYPYSWRKVGVHTRRFLMKRFPYLVLYVPDDERIVITAIAHQHRHPEYYMQRIK
ncbi:MAG TPA: type II toxin-antitoxin system RelE/ParE family toxin [Candidatus Hydrogenedentes bacterium]|nr:type II toxin-antitoxin system RelE/ParE family toxin [Candidatus Hydrogenedentota bacterium]